MSDKKFYSTLYKLKRKDINNLLEEFNRNTGKSGIYQKDIPYDYWRAFKSADKILILRMEDFDPDGSEVLYRFYVEDKRPLQKTTSWEWGNGIADFLEKNLSEYSLPSVTFYESWDNLLYDSSTGAFKWAESLMISKILSKAPVGDSPQGQKILIDPAPSWLQNKNFTVATDTAISISNNADKTELLEKRINNIENKLKEEEKENNMKGFKFDFGSCSNDNIRMSMYGLAVKNNADTWVSYDVKNDDIIDVDILNFDGRKFMFKMPVAIKDIAVGDIVIHNRIPMFVTGITPNSVKVVDVRAGERKEIMPTKSPFNFNYITKVVNLFDNMFGGSDPNMPFGNMLPFLMLNDENGKDMDMDTMMMLMMAQNGGMNLMQNPMMMYFMMKDGDSDSNMLPLIMMMNMNQTPSIQQVQAQNEINFINDNITKDAE